MGFWEKMPFHQEGSPEEKAAEFDSQVNDSTDRADKKREKGAYPYDLDRKAAGKERRRGK